MKVKKEKQEKVQESKNSKSKNGSRRQRTHKCKEKRLWSEWGVPELVWIDFIGGAIKGDDQKPSCDYGKVNPDSPHWEEIQSSQGQRENQWDGICESAL